MKSKLKRLGDYIKPVDERNRDLEVTFLRGIATSKQLIESNANMSGVSLSNYKIVRPRQFVYTSDTSRRGDKIALAFNTGDVCIVSSIYTVFQVDENHLLPEFLFMWFQRPEFDRYARFHSWGSARETFDWADMCEVRLPIPDDIDEQRKYVSLYNALVKNQQAYEKSLADLQLICDSFLEDLKNKLPHVRLGQYIEQSDERNRDLGNDNLRAISVNKKFMESRSDKDKLNLSGYKLIHPRQFGYVTVTSRNGDKISVAILEETDCIVSSTYCVFGVRDTTLLLPEYLYLWFKRSEFDRYARFHSFGSARETFDWADMCEVKLPIPDIEVQESIVAIHHTLETRKRLNGELKAQIQNLCPVLMRGVVESMA